MKSRTAAATAALLHSRLRLDHPERDHPEDASSDAGCSFGRLSDGEHDRFPNPTASHRPRALKPNRDCFLDGRGGTRAGEIVKPVCNLSSTRVYDAVDAD